MKEWENYGKDQECKEIWIFHYKVRRIIKSFAEKIMMKGFDLL
jgi:hypothetical protein